MDSLVNRNLTKTMAARAGVNLDLMDGRLKNTFSVQGFKMDRVVEGQDARYTGYRQKFDYLGSFEATDRILLQYGVDHERQRAETSSAWSAMDETHRLTGYWTQAVV